MFGVSLPSAERKEDDPITGIRASMRPEGLLAATERLGGSVAGRDRVVLAALAVGVVLALLVWRFVGPWPSLVLILVAVGVACAAYRIEPSRIDLDHPDSWTDESSVEERPHLDAR
jgi:hypothetical protein